MKNGGTGGSVILQTLACPFIFEKGNTVWFWGSW